MSLSSRIVIVVVIVVIVVVVVVVVVVGIIAGEDGLLYKGQEMVRRVA